MLHITQHYIKLFIVIINKFIDKEKKYILYFTVLAKLTHIYLPSAINCASNII